MKEVSFEIESIEELIELFDKTAHHILIHKFLPNPTIEWWKADLKIKNGLNLEGILVRDMEFDLQTDLIGLEKIVKLNTNQLRVYQFEKPVPDTLRIEGLPDNLKEKILKNNGLRHFFWIDYEHVSISSFNDDFIKSIENNPKFEERIKIRKGR